MLAVCVPPPAWERPEHRCFTGQTAREGDSSKLLLLVCRTVPVASASQQSLHLRFQILPLPAQVT